MLSDKVNNNDNRTGNVHKLNSVSGRNALCSPTSEYINMLLNTTKLDSPTHDPKYLQLNSSYTSTVALRDEVDKFDFDHSLKPNSIDEVSIGQKKNFDYHYDYDYDSDDEIQSDENDENPIDEFMNKLDEFKRNFQGLINTIDDALITENPMQHDIHDGIQIEKIQLFLDTVADLKHIVTEPIIKETEQTKTLEQYGKVDIREISINLHDRKVTDDPCSKLNNYGVILMRWPESIGKLWDEYSKTPSEWCQEYLVSFLVNIRKINEMEGCDIDINTILQRQSSIQELEENFNCGWRNEDKNFSRQINRRKKIWKAIEEGLEDGVSLENCIKVLTQYVEEKNKGISLYYKCVPFKIVDRYNCLKHKH